MADKRIAELLVKSGAYRDLESPVVLASGQLGIYFINTEKLLDDDGKWAEFGDDPLKMYSHLLDVQKKNPDFAEVIDVLRNKSGEMLSAPSSASYRVISGGQRRDWLFSMPVASALHISHLTHFKGESPVLLWAAGYQMEVPSIERDYCAVHIVDLITEGSSIYSNQGGEEMGWLPGIRNLSTQPEEVKGLLAVVDRLQGGREMLQKQGVGLTSFVEIDEDFLSTFSIDKARALSYHASPTDWSEEYLREHGATAFAGVFNPEGNKLKRAGNFMDRYEIVLRDAGKLQELETAVQERYQQPINEILER